MTRKRVHTEVVEDAHAYTRSDVPWALSNPQTPYERMISYISGGGMRVFGRTVRQEEIRRRQLRFLLAAAVLAVIWLLLLVF